MANGQKHHELFFSDAGFCCYCMTTATLLSGIWCRGLFYTQGNWNIQNRHWQFVKLSNSARWICFFYIPMMDDPGCRIILTQDSAV
jgi:hypothetical protein